MNKAILVLDMPSSCSECPINDAEYDVCQVTYEHTSVANRNEVIDGIHIKCPLKKLPAKLDDLGLEVWNNRKGNILAPKGLFDEIFESEEE